jgi:hypothetical protein
MTATEGTAVSWAKVTVELVPRFPTPSVASAVRL